MSSETTTPNPSVDNAGGVAPPDWSGFQPSEWDSTRTAPSVARSWFECVYKRSGRSMNLAGWRFTCPFCGEKDTDESHQEVYVRAYRHLAVCDWVMDPLWTGTLD